MTEIQLEQLSQNLKQINSLKEELGGVEGYWLDFKWDSEGKVGDLEGNSVGLISLAGQLLDLARRTSQGAHVHLDEHSMLGKGSDAIIVWNRSPKEE